MTDQRLPVPEPDRHGNGLSGHRRRAARARAAMPAVRSRARRPLVTAAVAVLGAGSAVAYRNLDGNIASQDVDGQLDAKARPERTSAGALNVLPGSDSRSGANRAYGRDAGGARSETAVAVWKALRDDRPLPARGRQGGQR